MSRVEGALRGIAAVGVLSAAGWACTSPKNPCEDANQNPTYNRTQLSDFSLRGQNQTLDLYTTKADDGWQKIGNLFAPDTPGVTRVGASIYHPDRELFHPERAELGIITDRQFSNEVKGRIYTGFLVVDGKESVRIVDINAYKAFGNVIPIDDAYKNNELLVLTLDLSKTPYDIDTIGSRDLKLYLSEEDCVSGQTVDGTQRVFDLKPTGYLKDTDNTKVQP